MADALVSGPAPGHLHRDRALLARTFSHREIYPPVLECHADEDLALVGAPLGGATLLWLTLAVLNILPIPGSGRPADANAAAATVRV